MTGSSCEAEPRISGPVPTCDHFHTVVVSCINDPLGLGFFMESSIAIIINSKVSIHQTTLMIGYIVPKEHLKIVRLMSESHPFSDGVQPQRFQKVRTRRAVINT